MKKHTLLAALLLSVAGAAHAYENFQNFSIYYPNTPWLRGNFNSWGKAPLVAATAYKYSGITYVGYVNVQAGSQAYKFDLSTSGNWSENYGDNYTADQCLDASGANIPFTQGAGTYEVRYNTGAQGYGCSRPSANVTKVNDFVATQRTMYLRSSFNNWGLLPMLLVKNNVWEAEVQVSPNTFGEFKFDVKGDWSQNYGRPAGTDPRSYLNQGTASVGGENLRLYVEDYSGNTFVAGKIRFNDSTREFALCYSGSTLPICQ